MDSVKFKNEKFRILQISDAQDMHWVKKTMLVMLKKACIQTKPDLVVFTGDNILGNHLSDKRFSKGKRNLTRDEEYSILKKALSYVLDIPEELKIPFAVIFGNHDDRNSFSKDEQGDIFRSYSMNCGFENREELCGTYRLGVGSSDGKSEKMNLWMIDTSRYDKEKDKCFFSITREETDWFISESENQKKLHGGKAPESLMFMHIPFERIKELTEECGGEQGTVERNGKYYRLKNGVKGEMYEYPDSVEDSFGFYDAVLRDGGVAGVVSGHDHVNSFEGPLDGMRFIATPGASFRSYGNKLRGVRVFDIDENDISHFSTFTLDYSDICGKSILAKIRYIWDADDKAVVKYTALGIACLAVLGEVVKCIIKFILK